MAERPKLIAEALLRGRSLPPTSGAVAQALLGTPVPPRPTSLYAQGLLGNNVGYGLSNYPTPPQPTLGQAFGKDAYEFASGLTAPLSSLDRMGRTLLGQQGGWTGRSDMIGDATTLASTFMGGGMAVPKPLGSVGIVGGNLAKTLNTALKIPDDPIFAQAVSGTPGARMTPDGLVMNLVRHQKPEQEGANAIRTGVFYLPEGSSNARHYKTGGQPGQWYGGPDKIQGETLIQNPLFVKGATGGKAPEAAYDTLKGKGSAAKLNTAARSAATAPANIKEEVVYDFLERNGGDPDMAWELIQNSKHGNQLTYALQEHIIAHAIRDAGHDAMVGYSKGKNGPFISEVFDTREIIGPSPKSAAGAGDIHPAYLKPKLST